MGNGVMAKGPKLPSPSSTLPLLTSPDKNILPRSEWLPALVMGGHNV